MRETQLTSIDYQKRPEKSLRILTTRGLYHRDNMTLHKCPNGVTNPIENHSSMALPLLSIRYTGIYLNKVYQGELTTLFGTYSSVDVGYVGRYL